MNVGFLGAWTIFHRRFKEGSVAPDTEFPDPFLTAVKTDLSSTGYLCDCVQERFLLPLIVTTSDTVLCQKW